MREMRGIAAQLRGDALSGLSPDEQEEFVDTLLAVKANLVRLANGHSSNRVEDEISVAEATRS